MDAAVTVRTAFRQLTVVVGVLALGSLVVATLGMTCLKRGEA